MVWTAYKKLASCESQDPDIECPASLCMEVLESLEEDNEEELQIVP
ncbi:hypothetical protein PG987_000472 [Apiospora arundinis]